MIILVWLQRQLNLLDYALSSLYRRRIKNIGIFAIFAAVIFLFSSLQLMTRGLTETARNILSGAPDITVQQMSAGRQVGLDSRHAEDLQKIFGVTRVVPRIWGYYFDEGNGANYTVVGLDAQNLPQGQLPSLQEGKYPDGPKGDGESWEVILSQAVKKSLGLGERRGFSLFRPDLSMVSMTTVGTFSPATFSVTADMMFMPLAGSRDLFSIPEPMVTDVMVYVANSRELDAIAGKIAERVPGSRVLTRKQIMKTYEVVFSWRSGFGGMCLLGSLLAFVILSYDKASGLSREDLREVGILKILGWQATDVMAIRFWESAVVSVMALSVGYILAWVHIVWWQGIIFRPLLLGWSVLRPDLHIVPSFHLGDLLVIFSLSVLPYLCATLIPAWRSGIVRPDTVV